MKLVKRLSTLLLCVASFAYDVTPSVNNISAFAIPKDEVSIKASFNYVDRDIDIFRSIEKSDHHDYGYIGKMSGGEFSVRYGFSRHISFLYNFQLSNMDYFNSNLTNYTNELVARVNFYDVPNYVFDVFTIDLGLVRDSGDDVAIKDAFSIAQLAKKINHYIPLSTSHNHLLYKGEVLTNQTDPKSGVTLKPKLNISDLSDNSFYIRFLLGNRFSGALLNLYSGLKYSDITTKIRLSPSSSENPTYKAFIGDLKDQDLSRNEKAIFGGINFIFESQNFVYDLNYEYDRLFSRGDLRLGSNHNSIFDINIAYKADKDLLFYFGGRAMLNGYNAVIPYFYNKYSQDNFDRYGYIKLGVVYNFNVVGFDSKDLFYFDENSKKSDSLSEFLFSK